MNGRKIIVAPSFEYEDRGFRVFGQAVSKDTPSRTCSNDNIVVHVHSYSNLMRYDNELLNSSIPVNCCAVLVIRILSFTLLTSEEDISLVPCSIYILLAHFKDSLNGSRTSLGRL